MKNLILFFIAAFIIYALFADDSGRTTATSSTGYRKSHATYEKVNQDVGCDSKYSKEKKKDIFNRFYKNHTMTWKGDVVRPKSGSTSLNIDGKGTQDLVVDFKNPNDGYNLEEDQHITIEFVMKSMGGCFLPFGGKEARIMSK